MTSESPAMSDHPRLTTGRLDTSPDGHEPRSLDDLVRAGDVAMLTTRSVTGALSSRPLTIAEVHGGVLTFLVDVAAPWFLDILDVTAAAGVGAMDVSSREVNVAISTGRNDWVSVRGRPAVSADATTIDRLWSPAAAAHFDGRDDPGVRALQVSVIDGEYWSAPGGGAVGRLVSVIGAALGRDGAAGSAHGEVRRD